VQSPGTNPGLENLRRFFDHGLRQMELRDPGCRRRRAALRVLPRELTLRADEIEQVQRRLVDRLVEREVVIEAAPSSNLATGGLAHLAEHPLFRIREYNRGIRVTLNCDDPGTFATRLENEYALVKDALIERRAPADEIEAFLEELVATARHAGFARGPVACEVADR